MEGKMTTGRKVCVGFNIFFALATIFFIGAVALLFYDMLTVPDGEGLVLLALIPLLIVSSGLGCIAIVGVAVIGLVLSIVVLKGKGKACKIWGTIFTIYFSLLLIASAVLAIMLRVGALLQ